jgi:hypothetical protein
MFPDEKMLPLGYKVITERLKIPCSWTVMSPDEKMLPQSYNVITEIENSLFLDSNVP